MSNIVAITGSKRSGTSCLTGLLELCGFDLGENIRVLRNSTRFNAKGHFETDLLFTINQRLLEESPGRPSNLFSLPSQKSLLDLAVKREKYFRFFIRKFDGNLVKDPLLCATFHLWEKRWPELNRVIFCLRHPLAVAKSMQDRYSLPLESCFDLWLAYINAFFDAERRSPTYVFDFDAFCKDPFNRLTSLLEWLEHPVTAKNVQKHVENFYEPKIVHYSKLSVGNDDTVPDYIQVKYHELLARINDS